MTLRPALFVITLAALEALTLIRYADSLTGAIAREFAAAACLLSPPAKDR